MTPHNQCDRSSSLPQGRDDAATDDRTVLRLSRAALRSQHPQVRFVDHFSVLSRQGRLPWLV